MKPRTLGLALVAGLAAVLLVGIGVTELLQPRIEFSPLVGIPAGAVAGAVTAAAVARGVAGDGPGPRRVAFTVAAFGAAFLGTSVVMAVLVDPGVVRSMLVGLGAGLVAAVVGDRRGRGMPPASLA